MSSPPTTHTVLTPTTKLVLKPVVQFSSPQQQQQGEDEVSLGKVPAVGEDTRAILGSMLGYDHGQIQALFDSHVVEETQTN